MNKTTQRPRMAASPKHLKAMREAAKWVTNARPERGTTRHATAAWVDEYQAIEEAEK